jgi:hypothetical protein
MIRSHGKTHNFDTITDKHDEETIGLHKGEN